MDRTSQIIAGAVFGSVVLHLVAYGTLKQIPKRPPEKKVVKVAVNVKEKEAPPEPAKIPPKPKKKPPPKPKKLPQKRKPKKKPIPNAKKVQGLTEDSVVKDSGVAAPLGNTLMKEDEGKRLTPDQIAALKQDLSADAILIRGSFIQPEYTQAALDAYLEGRYVVDVYVDEKGKVLDAELRKKIGYGMDSRVIDVARSARFSPRKNAKGVPMAGWTEIAFYLEIP